MSKILIVEDDEKIARVIELELMYAGYEVEIAHTGKVALELYQSNKYDLILLDVMIPELNGLEVLRRIRQVDEMIKIIMLTARDTVFDKVTGLDLGANDYMTKPFEIEELLARMRVHLKAIGTTSTEQSELTFKHLNVNPNTREVYAEGKLVTLTQKEYDLLYYLLTHRNQVLTREQMIEAVWGYDYHGDTNVTDVYVRHLRKKLDTDKPSLISSVRGVGYMMKD
ncbi:response regulator transcription factor [Staphylococcus massiliensis]|uniref:response regulator transcription factor n=1 Tax=Staphylococcus massiliensis TaxID=555791 RepID=UPI001EE02341|nr:response regulator transcription factor [Staphylococcus massiliensis]MCG3400587.1 response regulator transcription factor [Staphylococcus massiliensis]